ncbi:MAG: cation-translocating P-type ATPase [Bacteroidia bacterium]|nr:cation-translocating P-type ATPase [Bacteroidia bacterium]
MNTPDSAGLSSTQVETSRSLHGSNRMSAKTNQNLKIIRDVVTEPMILLLVATCTFYFILGNISEGIIMLGAIILVSGISVFQQIRSEKAVNALHKLTSQRTMVKRNGIDQELPSEDLVVGDLIYLSEGQQVSADATIVSATDLSVDESILTGESVPVVKNAAGEPLFSGTSLVGGMAWATVTAVGNQTKMGGMGILMDSISKEKTPLQKQVDHFVKQMAVAGIMAFVVVCVVNYLKSHAIIPALLNGLTMAMAILPEEIPVALSTFMALGAYRMLKNHVLVKHPQTIEALGAATVICVDKTGTITENKMQVAEIFVWKEQQLVMPDVEIAGELIKVAMLASEAEPFDPMEKAIHQSWNTRNKDASGFSVIKEYPLGGIHPMMTHVYQDKNGIRIIATKGAPEGVLKKSNLQPSDMELIQTKLKEMASRGNRVLAIGEGIYENGVLPETQDAFTFKFLGLLALNDPPKANIPEIIAGFYEAGISVKMITGDYPETAAAIGRKIGLHNSDEVLTGNAIDKLTDEELSLKLKTVSVLARVIPENKLRVIQLLKTSGDIVAMTGDGVNDGPALKAAHIGISMGKRGSELARSASSLVLINDDLAGMLAAVSSGRTIYKNLRNAIRYIITIHLPLISIVTLPLLLGWKFPELFTPVHVIFLELLMGPTCSIVFENEPADGNEMHEAPRKSTASLFTWKELASSLFQGAIIGGVILSLVFVAMQQGANEAVCRTIAFTALVVANMLLTLTGRSDSLTFLESLKRKNSLVPIILSITTLLLMLLLTIPAAMDLFGFQLPELKWLLFAVAAAFLGVIVPALLLRQQLRIKD